MSKSVKIWVSILLVTLAGYTLYSMFRISNQLSERRADQEDVTANGTNGTEAPGDQPLKPVDLDAFKMTSQEAEQFAFKDLAGKVWIASLFFSSCPHECKSLNQTISALNRDPDLFSLSQSQSILMLIVRKRFRSTRSCLTRTRTNGFF